MSNWQSYLLDSNLILAYLQGEVTIARKLAFLYRAGAKLPVPAVVYYEVMRGYHSIKDKKEREQAIKVFEKFFRDRCDIFQTGPDGWTHAAHVYGLLKRSGITTDEGDVIIMGTAREHQRKIATRNIQDFENVMSGKCEKW
jgi:predicted nucleic acid-binding protein